MVYFIFNLCLCSAVPAFILLIFYMFIVMHQNIRSNSFYVKIYLAINQILILILILKRGHLL